MSKDERRPTLTDKTAAEADERRRRQAEALRANLARRKQQTRARATPPDGEVPPDGGGADGKPPGDA